MALEVVAARIVLRVAELRLLAAWTSVLAGRERLPEAQGRAASVGSAAQLLAASRPLRSYIRFASKAEVNSPQFTASLSVAKCQFRTSCTAIPHHDDFNRLHYVQR